MDDITYLPVATTVDTTSFGKGGDVALQSVFRIVDREKGSSGTGFLHKSGNIITADHVVTGGLKPIVLLPDGTYHKAKVIASSKDLDIAILSPGPTFRSVATAAPLRISAASDLKVGTQVSTWGFPGGYPGMMPMLSVGVLSAVAAFANQDGKAVHRWVVNAAFNSGNSGGPLLHLESGEVIGVVSSKLAQISQNSRAALQALSGAQHGFSWTRTKPDGSTVNMTEGQIIAGILDELREQVQLVIGMAVLLDDMRQFLTQHNIDP
jgi:serine protease Do